MMEKEKITKESVMAKVEAGIELTRQEDIFYFIKILNHTMDEALNILAIVENKDPGLIID